jgi:hypothetical protein
VNPHLTHPTILAEIVESCWKIGVGKVENAPNEWIQQHQILLDLLAILQKVLEVFRPTETFELENLAGWNKIIGHRLKKFVHTVGFHQPVVFFVHSETGLGDV